MAKKLVSVEGSRTIYTYAYLYEAARQSLMQAKSTEAGQSYNCMSTIVFCAFTLEAYFNHLGKQKLSSWTKIERKLGPKEKLALLLDIIDHTVDDSRKPFQTLIEIFKFRDALAHGKTEDVQFKSPQKMEEEGLPRDPQLFWESFCNIVNAERCVEDTASIVTELHKFAGKPHVPLGLSKKVVMYREFSALHSRRRQTSFDNQPRA